MQTKRRGGEKSVPLRGGGANRAKAWVKRACLGKDTLDKFLT